MKEVYVGVDVHGEESQVAVFTKGGELVQENRVRTNELSKFISIIKGKHIAIEAVGFIHPIYDELKKNADCTISVTSPIKAPADSQIQVKE